MSQPGDGSRFAPENSYGFSEHHQATLCWDAILAWPSSLRLSVAPIAPAATPARARGVDSYRDRDPSDRRPTLQVWERRIAGHACGAPPRIESSTDSDFLIGDAPFGAGDALN